MTFYDTNRCFFVAGLVILTQRRDEEFGLQLTVPDVSAKIFPLYFKYCG